MNAIEVGAIERNKILNVQTFYTKKPKLYISNNIQDMLRLENFGHLTPKQADILIKYLEKYPNLELDFSDKYGYMEDHPFAVTTSVFSSLGLSDEFDIKVSHKKPLFCLS